MRFTPTDLPGVMLVESDPHTDERGFFARTFCRQEFTANGLCGDFAQCSLSRTTCRETIRGLHFQAAPHEEHKLVRCVRGRIFDVVVDLRPDSPTHRRWLGVELGETSQQALYVPPGVAHGFQTLADDVDVLYQISAYYVPGSARGVRWDDSAFGIRWPFPHRPTLSDRDRNHPDYTT